MAPSPPTGANRAFCVTIAGDVASYRRTDARHAPEPDRAGDLSVGGAERACDGAGTSASATDVVAELDRVVRRREIAPWIPLGSVLVVYLATIGALGVNGGPIGAAAAFVVALGASVGAYAVARGLDRERGSARVYYHLDGDASARFARLRAATKRLAACHRVWHVPPEGRGPSSGHKFGATLSLRRYRIRPGLTLPPRVGSNLRVPTLYGERRKYYFCPDRVLAFDEHGVRALEYGALHLKIGEALSIEDEDVPFDAKAVDTTWLHVRPDGSPDPTIANNRRYPIVLYGELEFVGAGGMRELFRFSQPGAADAFFDAIEAIANRAEVDEEPDEEAADDEPRTDDEAEPEPADESELDAIYDDALRAIVRANEVTLDLLVRELGVTFGRAALVVARMETDGYVGPASRNANRKINGSATRHVALLAGSGEKRRERTGEPNARRRTRRRAQKRPASVVLGVREGATSEEISAAYRELAQQYHPDKVATLAPEFQELAELRMKEINAAYAALRNRARD